jgi:hypothetical protein
MTEQNNFILYTDSNGAVKLNVFIEDETIWLSKKLMAELFEVDVRTISEHIQNIYKTHELAEISTVRNFRIVQKEGTREVNREIAYYNLDMIIAVGYRVNSKIATQFRIWATQRLKEYILKGFTMDDERLKNLGGGNYWKELLTRIRDIRASEKVFYRQILDIYATSIDYDANNKTSIEFFKKVQNKIHYAVHKQTAAEVIYNRADAEKEFMGLTTFTGNKPQLQDISIAKNYLDEKELRALGQIVSGYLDFAERQAERQVPMKMQDWADHLDSILLATGEEVLQNAVKISNQEAMQKAQDEYKKYQQKTLSPVEQSYLDTINQLESKFKKK